MLHITAGLMSRKLRVDPELVSDRAVSRSEQGSTPYRGNCHRQRLPSQTRLTLPLHLEVEVDTKKTSQQDLVQHSCPAKSSSHKRIHARKGYSTHRLRRNRADRADRATTDRRKPSTCTVTRPLESRTQKDNDPRRESATKSIKRKVASNGELLTFSITPFSISNADPTVQTEHKC